MAKPSGTVIDGFPVGRLTHYGRDAFAIAQSRARGAGAVEVETEHLLAGVLWHSDSVAARVLERLNVDPALVLPIKDHGDAPGAELRLSQSTRQVLRQAFTLADEWGDWSIGTAHLLLAIVQHDRNRAAELLREAGVVGAAAGPVVLEFCREVRHCWSTFAAVGEPLPAWFPRERSRPPLRPVVRHTFAWLVFELIFNLIFAMPAVALGRGTSLFSWVPFAAFLWTGLACAVAMRELIQGDRRGWAKAEALLFVTSACSLALLVGIGPQVMLAYVLCAVPFNLFVWFHLWAVVLVFRLFRERKWFGVGEREGWRVLMREGRWVLGVTAALQLGTLAQALRAMRGH